MTGLLAIAFTAAAGPVTSLDAVSTNTTPLAMLRALDPHGFLAEAYQQCLECSFEAPELPTAPDESVLAMFPNPVGRQSAAPEADGSWAELAGLVGIALVSAPMVLRTVVSLPLGPRRL